MRRFGCFGRSQITDASWKYTLAAIRRSIEANGGGAHDVEVVISNFGSPKMQALKNLRILARRHLDFRAAARAAQLQLVAAFRFHIRSEASLSCALRFGEGRLASLINDL